MKKFLAVILAVCTLAFGAFAFTACNNDDGDAIDVYAPDGAPALALAQLMSEEMQFGEKVNYHVVNASTIDTYVTGEDLRAELCVLPVNAAAAKLGSGENYKMLGTVTHGNIYIVSNTEKTELTRENLATQLEGKVVGCIQLQSFVGFALQIVLNDLDIHYTIIEDANKPAESGVSIVNIAKPADQITGETPYDYMVAAEPVVSAKTGAIETLEIVGDLQKLYGESGYPQAVLVAKNDLIENNAAFVEKFIAAVEANASWLLNEQTSAETIVNAVSSHLPEGSTPTFNAKNLTKTVIQNCAVRFESAAAGKDRVKEFLSEITSVNNVQFNVSDGFFYAAQ